MKVIDVRDTTLWRALSLKLRTQDEEISLLLDLQSAADQLGEDFDGNAMDLNRAFTWASTMQGGDFWYERHNELSSREDRAPQGA